MYLVGSKLRTFTDPDIIQILTLVVVNIRIYRSKIYAIYRGRIVEKGKFDIPNTHIHHRSVSWLSTGTSIENYY